MDLKFSAEFIASAVDFGIIVCTVALLVYAVRTGMFRSKPLTAGGRALIVAGLIVGVAAQLAHTWVSMIGTIDPHGTAAATSTEWAHWVFTRAALMLLGIGLFLAWYQRRETDKQVTLASERLRDAERSVIRSEARYRYLFENSLNAVYCFQMDPPIPVALPLEQQMQMSRGAVLIECNPAYASVLGGVNPSDVIGTQLRELPIANAPGVFQELVEELVENDYYLSEREFSYQNSRGELHTDLVSMSGVVEDGNLVRLWGVESDVSRLRQTEAELQRQRRFEELLAHTSTRLVMSPDDRIDGTIHDCLREVCEFHAVDRGTLWWLDRDVMRVDPSYMWRRWPREIREHDVAADFPFMTSDLMRGRVFAIDDVDAMPDAQGTDRDNLKQIGVAAVAIVPLMVGGQIVGAASFACDAGPRKWSEQELQELRVFADVFASFVLRLNSRRALDDAMARLQQASERLEAENVYLRKEVELTKGFDEIIGQSDAIMHCLHLVERVADTMTSVLLLGATGTGKELVARAIHAHSGRSDRPLVKVNCAALPASLIESELFGHEKGAFTGAEKKKKGRFDLADGSTLFLDEIGELPIDLQSKLLRVLQEGEFERVGGSETVSVDVRVIAATNRDLHQAVADGEFRSDLFFRINTFPIELPPLRDRGDDVQLLSEHFVKLHAQRLGKDVKAISASMMRQLKEYHWPGNVRELEGVIERAIIASGEPVLKLASPLVPQAITEETSPGPTVISSTISDLKLVERDHILATLEACNWRISGKGGAAQRLGLPPSTLRSKMKKLAIERPH